MHNTDNYVCGDCSAKGVRLWREYNTVLEAQTLRCMSCAVRQQGKAPDGDTIGWLVPAVPAACGSFWGYTSVPQEGCDWWYALPISEGA